MTDKQRERSQSAEVKEAEPQAPPAEERQPGLRERHDRWMEAITFAEAGQPEVAKEILGLTPSAASKFYGDIVYWGTVAAAVIAMIGQVITFITRANYLDPSYLLTAIWQSKSVDRIWETAVGALPRGHWYLQHLGTGDGFTELGLAVGVFIVIPAMLVSALALYKQRMFFFGTLAVIAAAITVSSMFGLIPLPIA
ncbi:MAG: hypothetical protein ACLFVT_08310 [Syntrophobacteria bacterium]